MSELLDKTAVAHRLKVSEKTAATLMMEMSPIAISGTVRKQYRVSEENLERWIAKKMIGKPTSGGVCMGSKKKLKRRG